MSYQELKKKLQAAEGEVQMAEAAHREAALLATETGAASATTKLDKATTALKDARQSVINLTAAVEAGAARETARIKSGAAEAARVREATLNTRRAVVQGAGQAWDAALDSLVAATNHLIKAGASYDEIACDGTDNVPRGPCLSRAQSMALEIVQYRISFWTRRHEMLPPSQKIASHLI